MVSAETTSGSLGLDALVVCTLDNDGIGCDTLDMDVTSPCGDSHFHIIIIPMIAYRCGAADLVVASTLLESGTHGWRDMFDTNHCCCCCFRVHADVRRCSPTIDLACCELPRAICFFLIFATRHAGNLSRVCTQMGFSHCCTESFEGYSRLAGHQSLRNLLCDAMTRAALWRLTVIPCSAIPRGPTCQQWLCLTLVLCGTIARSRSRLLFVNSSRTISRCAVSRPGLRPA